MLCVLAVRDRAIDGFNRPIFAQSIGMAIRMFQDELNRVSEDNLMNHHPEDFDLYELGSWDDTTGKFVLLDSPRQVAIGRQLTTKGL